MKKIITSIIALIFLTSLVSAIGITYPHPQNIELKPGQSSFFTFQIQSDDFPLVCIPSIKDNQGLELAFNPQYQVEANQKFIVKPQIIIPKETPLGDYKVDFCIECSPTNDNGGSRIIPKICNLPITVNVVSERTRQNMLEESDNFFKIWITLLILAIIILAIVIIYLVRKKKKKIKERSFIKTDSK